MPKRAAVIDLCSDSDSSDDFPSPSDARYAGQPVAKTEPVSPQPNASMASAVVKEEGSSSRVQVQFTPYSQTTPSQKAKKIKKEPRNPHPPSQPQEIIPFSTILSSLNKAQRRAVTSHTDTVAILAGPGSGKTHTLTSRVVWLIDQVGYRPRDIVVATFTVKAAREMKERIGKVLGDGRERQIVLGTFHSVARRYLATYGKRIGLDPKFSIIDDGDSRGIITRIIKRLDLTTEVGSARAWISKKKTGHLSGKEEEQKQQQTKKKTVSGSNSNGKGDYYENLKKIHAEYQAHLESLNLLDYDDLLVKCADLLRQYPSCVANVQAVLIDEYQDTNGIQFELMKLFAQARRHITVVGDPDQSIYGWRSADYTNLSRFLQEFSDTAEISLEENYRSSQRILDTSLQVIQQDKKRYQKILLPVHKKGTLPVLRTLRDGPSEAEWIVGEISRAMQMTGGMLGHDDVAILVRSASLSRPIETALGSAGIPYRMIGGRKFFDRAEIKVLVDYLRIVHQPNNNDALARIINVPRRGIGEKTLKALLDEAETAKISLWALITQHCRGDRTATTTGIQKVEKKIGGFIAMILVLQGQAEKMDEDAEDPAAKGQQEWKPGAAGPTLSALTSSSAAEKKPLTLIELIETLLRRLQFQTFIRDKYGGDEETRWANVEEFVKLAREFMMEAKANEDEDDLPEVDGVDQVKERNILSKFLANVTLAANPDKKKDADQDESMVTISTIHAAKGLEWPVVFIPAAYTGCIPHSRSEDSDEERRLLYVAMTRAKCLLNISFAVQGLYDRNNNNNNNGDHGQSEQELSVFLASVPRSSFAERGPSYNRDLLEEMGDILRRRVPTDEEIFQALPTGMILEDDRFPLDPIQAKRDNDKNVDAGDGYGGRWNSSGGGGGGFASKKRKPYLWQTPDYTGSASANLSGFGGGNNDGPGAWNKPYATTMDGAASFPGFTTATAHRAALQAAAQAEQAHEALAQRSAAQAKRQAAAMKGGQQTIMQSFVRSHADPEQGPRAKAGLSASLSSSSSAGGDDIQFLSMRALGPAAAGRGNRPMQHQQQQHAPQLPGMMSAHGRSAAAARPGGIPPELKTRKLGDLSTMTSMRPPVSRLPPDGRSSKDGSASGQPDRSTRYAHFSSSPTRGGQQQRDEPQNVPSAPPPPPPQQQYRSPYMPGGRPRYPAANRPTIAGKENVVGVGGGAPTLAKVSSFHATTFAQASGPPGSRKRPASSISGGAIAPMDKLRMPFKPPSIKRPQ